MSRSHAERTGREVQLHLLSGDKRRPEWALDDTTRRIGRAGVAAVRETLRKAQPPEPFQKAS